jgi:hypothetical protein
MANRYHYPRPEYPRPDFQRGTIEGDDWLNLNGPWQFRFDGSRSGEAERWFTLEEGPWREQIIVPFCWESLAAWGDSDAAGNQNYYATRVFRNPLEVTRENHRYAPRYEVGWYRREVIIPKSDEWKGKRVILKIGAADFFTDAWCNGIHLGHHEGGYLPFEFDLTDALERLPDGMRRGLIVLRVEDPMDNHEQPVGKQWRWYTTTSGIWQTVYIEPRGQAHIDHFRIFTDLDAQTARFEIACKNATDAFAVAVEITPPEGNLSITTIPVKNSLAQQQIRIEQLCLWNPNEPNVYRVKLRLIENGKEHDLVRTYFGMRQITTAPTADPKAPEALCLNGVQRYHRGALYQSYFPEGVYTAADVQTLKDDIAFAKKVGFNFLRVHIKIDDPLLLYYADTMGMLLMCDFPNFGEGGDTALGRKRYEEMMRGAIRRDFNHPSIFAWCCFNETWGFGGQVEFVKLFSTNPEDKKNAKAAGVSAAVSDKARNEAEAATAKVKISNQSSHAFVREMWKLAKELDPTRLIEDMSVVHWEHLDYYAHGETDINSWHFYMQGYGRAREHIEKIVKDTYAGSSFNYADGFQQKHQPLINSEYGGVGALDGDCDISWSFKFLTNELRRHNTISGYIFTQLTDLEWEYNGFLNYDRTPKEFGYDPRIINESDVLPLDAPPIARHAPGESIAVDVSSSHYSSAKHENVVLMWKLSGVDTLGKIHQDIIKDSVPIEFPHRRVAHAHTIKLEFPQSTMLCTLSVEAYKRDGGQQVARNFIQFLATKGYPEMREEIARTVILRARPENWIQAEWSGYSGTREQAAAADACWGFGHGFFEWEFPAEGIDLPNVRRIRVLCEASSRRIDVPQTDDDLFPTSMQMLLNDVRVSEANLPNHPHDSRGALSYLRNGKGAYGYLLRATVEEALLAQVRQNMIGPFRLRCAVPSASLAPNGLQIYGAECGRYPVCPTLVIEW